MTVPTRDYSLLYFILLICFVVLTAKLTAQSTVMLNQEVKSKADQLIEKSIAEKIFTGMTAGISINGNRAWMKAKGYSNAKAKDNYYIKHRVLQDMLPQKRLKQQKIMKALGPQ